MPSKRRAGAIAAAAVCALAGAAAGISQSVAAKSSTKHTTHSSVAGARPGPPGGGMGGPGGGGGGAVHSVSEVLDKAGTAYIAQTTDSGTITEVGESSITVKEGTDTVTYATPTISIPSGATVTLHGKTSALSDLKSGDRVTISSSSEGTSVFATDSSWTPGSGGPGGGGWSGGGGQPPQQQG